MLLEKYFRYLYFSSSVLLIVDNEHGESFFITLLYGS